MAKDKPFRGGSIGNDMGRPASPDGWHNPRDGEDARAPEQRHPDIDRFAVGSNDERFRR